jgi:hypothetical protein
MIAFDNGLSEARNFDDPENKKIIEKKSAGYKCCLD